MPEPRRIEAAEARELVSELRKSLTTSKPERLLAYATELADMTANLYKAGKVTSHTWSANNWMLLRSQQRKLDEKHIGVYAGKGQWAKAGREVLDAATAKAIWRPAIRKDDDAEDTDGAPALATDQMDVNGAQRRGRIVGFAAVPVYDWSDTRSIDGTPDPDWSVPLSSGDQSTFDRLAASSPVPVTVGAFPGSAHGYLSSVEGIRIDDRLSIGNQISTLCHELTHHHLGHLAADLETAEAEQEAALGQYLALVMLGVGDAAGDDIRTQAAEYLSTWGTAQGYKLRGKLLNKRLDAGLRAADAIVDGYVVAGRSRLAEMPAIAS